MRPAQMGNTIWLTLVYCLNVNMISGALYHLVATYSVMKPVSVPLGSAVLTDRARPKSHTCVTYQHVSHAGGALATIPSNHSWRSKGDWMVSNHDG